MKRVFSLIVISMMLLSAIHVYLPIAKAGSSALDAITVNSDGAIYYSAITLSAGVQYRIHVEGTYVAAYPSQNQQDAMYATHDGWITHLMYDPITRYTAGGLYMIGWDAPSFKPWGEYNPEHTYEYAIIGNGTVAGFWIYDLPGTYWDNSGSLTVSIYSGEPVGYWKLDEGSGNVALDSSGNGNDGAITGAEWVNGINGHALRFSDSSTYVTMARFPDGLDGNKEFTVSLWTKVNSWPSLGQQYSYLIYFGRPGIDTGFHILLDGRDGEHQTVGANFWGHVIPTVHTFSTGVWYNWVFVYNTTGVQMYQNGVFLESIYLGDGASPNLDPAGALMIGGGGPGFPEQSFDGIIDQVAIYDYARTAEEILSDSGLHSPMRVLHVSTNMNNEVQRIVDNLSMTTLFAVTQVSLLDFNAGVPGNLSQYDVIVFGINNCGEDYGPYSGVYGRNAELSSYVESGGGVVWTHDTLEYGANHYGDDIERPAGVDYCDAAWVGLGVFNLRILQDHPVLHAPFEIGNVGDLIPKTQGPPGCQVDHTSGGTVTTAEIIIEHQTVSAPNNFFLTVNEYGRGRVAVIVLGDAMDFDGSNLESTRENQILANAIYWTGSGRFQSEWGDVDNDGIPNYLDHAEFNATLLNGNPSLLDMNWGLSLWYITPRTSVQDMMSVLQQWGVDVAGSYDYAYALVVDLTTPFAHPSDFLNWLKQYFEIDISLQYFAEGLHEISGSDSHIRFLIVAKNLTVGNPEFRCYWLVDHSPIAAVLAVAIIILVLPTLIQIASKAVKAFRLKYDIPRALLEIGAVVIGAAMEGLLAYGAMANPLATLPFLAVYLSTSYVDALKEYWNVCNGDPYYDLCLFDSLGQPVLGYENGSMISASSYGLYFGRNDGMQFMLLSTSSFPCNLTVSLGAETTKSYIGCIQNLNSNSSTILSGIIAPNETISGLLYNMQNQTMVNHLNLDWSLSEQRPFKGDVVSIDAHVKDENMTDVSDATVQISYANQTISASNLGNGNYHAGLDTSLLEYGNTTINLMASREGCFDTVATESVSIAYDIAIKEISVSRTTAGLMQEVPINVTFSNFGDYAGSTNVTLYANTTIIETQRVDLEDGNSTIVTFSWNTTGFALGNYTISVYAEPVQGETNIADNNFTGGWIVVSIPGDLTGGTRNPWDFVPDGKVDGKDIAIVALCFGSAPGCQPPWIWNPNSDVNNDGKVDGKDIALVALHFGEANFP